MGSTRAALLASAITAFAPAFVVVVQSQLQRRTGDRPSCSGRTSSLWFIDAGTDLPTPST
ncbi:hypothetical protein Q2K19_21990 [Micromonospora soli]|uniref:hypothetical protein n=1 Tax=Micromonospora sp. NBRC 110009 TaxID=3061627 RepID=UPI002670E066|nr:hypothetical protein [Micromonospora sp. NBRC 110009]WKT96851.1 hypothetical protein Q2K19_21990 [Micromonospora sp. NBRC 110009]